MRHTNDDTTNTKGPDDMNAAKIEAAKVKAAIPYEVAKQIRELLDQARKSYGPSDWDGDDIEARVIELVTEE